MRRLQVVAAALVCNFASVNAGAEIAKPPIDLYQRLDPGAVAGVPIPEDYEWWAIDEISVAVLRPAAWLITPKRHEVGGWTYASRPRPSDRAHDWGAHFMMQVFWHPGGLRGATAARDVFRALVNGISSDPTCSILSTSSSAGALPDVTNIKMRFRKAPKGGPTTLAHKLFIADEQHGLVYVATFEAHEDQWEAAWNVGASILARVLVGFKR